MRLTSLILAGYLVLALVPLLAGHPDTQGLGIAAIHLVLAAFLLRRALRADPVTVGLADWFPLVLVPFLYAELPLLNQWVAPGYHDPVVQWWEAALLGGQPSATWAGAMPWAWLSEPLHAAYLSYYPLIYLPLLPHHLRGRARAFHATVLGLVLAFLACYLAFIVFPVQGPRYLGSPDGIPDGPVRALTLAILETGSSRGAAFPSSHVAVATVQAFMAVRFHGVRGWPVALLAALLAAGAVYGGFHYAVDALVGAGVGLLAGWTALRLGPEGSGEPA